jgi:Spy/CpxP family protein refolding chaperone
MWNKLKKPLLAFSVGLNIAFIAIWLVSTVPNLVTEQEPQEDIAESAAASSSLYRELGLTPDQRELIEPQIQRFREQAEDQCETIRTLRAQLMELLAAATVDETAMSAKQEEILAGQRQMQDLVIELLLKEKEILSPEQQGMLLKAIHRQCNCGETGGCAYGSGLGPTPSVDEPPLFEEKQSK